MTVAELKSYLWGLVTGVMLGTVIGACCAVITLKISGQLP